MVTEYEDDDELLSEEAVGVVDSEVLEADDDEAVLVLLDEADECDVEV